MESLDALTKAGDALQKAGPWGLLALSLYVSFRLYIALRESEKGRLEDSKAQAVAVATLTTALNGSSSATVSLTDQIKVVSRNDELRATLFERLFGVLAAITQSLDRLEHR